MRRHQIVLGSGLTLALSACQALGPRNCTAPAPATRTATLERWIADLDWFAVRKHLAQSPRDSGALRLYFEARCSAAFNRCEHSSRLALSALTQGTLSARRAAVLGLLLAANAVRLTRWNAGYAATSDLLRTGSQALTAVELADLRNLHAICQVLRDVPPRSASIEASFTVEPDERGRAPLTIQGRQHAFAIDTGANFSVITRSVANSSGLRIRPVGIPIGTSLGDTMRADVAIADRVRIGAARLRNVPFLVFPDAMLTFGDGMVIPGLIGFGELESMNEIRLMTGGRIGVFSNPPRREACNVALHGVDPITTFRCRGINALARLDTGASRSVFYAPFLREHRRHIQSIARPDVQRTAGVGSVAQIPTWQVPKLEIRMAGVEISVNDALVYQEALPRVHEGRIHANIGRDILDEFHEVVLDFRSMSLVLIP